jgi:hypothetical protein
MAVDGLDYQILQHLSHAIKLIQARLITDR